VKKGIHPTIHTTDIVCTTCGTHWPTGSTKANMRVDVCSRCHPFYTGEQRIVDTAGQVDRFMRRLRSSQEAQAEQARRREVKNQPAPKKPSLLQEIYGDEE
jgi:large subunit ribosomal protein L31